MTNPFVFGLPTPEMSVAGCAQLVLRYQREAPLRKDMATVLLRRCSDPSAVLAEIAGSMEPRGSIASP